MDQTYDERPPLPELSGLVRTVWIQRTGSEPYPQRNLPTGGVELHCPVGGVPRLIGPLTQAQLQVIPPRTTIVGVRFMPVVRAVSRRLVRPFRSSTDAGGPPSVGPWS